MGVMEERKRIRGIWGQVREGRQRERGGMQPTEGTGEKL